ncbi:hypothetical protein EKO27_g11075 [Xylaria grammica]|uniref:Uncharacterized protein n=1 Tax=Xylaria grammica TaxID=363999 RepID=A0A439CPD9_9PEZI|nr:hypothetical protein EKO27_g11075 [Xylaria grammica]
MASHVPAAASSDNTIAAPGTSGNAGPSRKTKAPHEYSTNPNTLRVRQRNARLTPYRRDVERARSNDLKAVSGAWKERMKTETFQAAPASQKKKILDNLEKEVMDRRRRKKIDAASKIFSLNQKYRPDEAALTPRSGHVSNTAAKSVSRMAPPGYIPYPTQPIPDLMEMPKNEASPPASLTTVAPAPGPVPVAAGSYAGDETVQSTSETPAPSVTSPRSSEASAAIEDLQKQREAEKRCREEDKKHYEKELLEIRGMVEGVFGQLQHITTFIRTIRASGYHYGPPAPHFPAFSHGLPLTQAPVPRPVPQLAPRFNQYMTDDVGYDNGYTPDDAGASQEKKDSKRSGTGHIKEPDSPL